jgi:hypothetical protein
MKVVLRRADGAWSLSSQTFATKSAKRRPEQVQQESLLDERVGAGEQRGRHGKAERDRPGQGHPDATHKDLDPAGFGSM